MFEQLLNNQIVFSFKSKRVINVGGAPPAASGPMVPEVQDSNANRIRVSCGHCNETFVVTKFFF